MSYDATNCTVSGSNTYLACFVARGNVARTVSSVTWDTAGANQALSAIASTAANNSNQALGEWYGLANPTAGTNKSVTVATSGTGVAFVTQCVSYSSVDQAAPASGGATSAVDGTSASVAVTSASGDLVLAGLAVNQGSATGDPGAGAGETLEVGIALTTRATADENVKVGVFSEAGAASVTMNPSWTTSEDNVICAFSLKAAAAARPIAPFIFQ